MTTSTTSSSALVIGGAGGGEGHQQQQQHRGAGGKLKRPFSRRQPSTPYARPPAHHRLPGGGGGWVSKIISPAYRLISGGANRLLPSLFSTTRSLPPLAPLPHDHDAGETSATPDARTDNQKSVDNLSKSKSFGVVPVADADQNPRVSVSLQDKQHKPPETSSVTKLSDIEQMINGKTFCREEIDRLMEILQARVVDAEQDQKLASTGTSGKVDDAEIAPVRPRFENKEKLEDINKGWTASTPLVRPVVREEVGMSPVELAKAYMSSRTSEVDLESKSIVLKGDRPSIHTGDMSSNHFLAPTSPKPSIHWPGAVIQEEHSLVTPYSQRGRYGLQSHPRTPYSRPTYSNTKSKLSPFEGQNRKLLNISSTPFSQKQTPVYGQLRKTSAENGHGSVGPIRSARHKFASHTSVKASPSLWSSKKDVSHVSDQNRSLAVQNFEHEFSSSSIFRSANLKDKPETGISCGIIHPQTSKLARQILEQISKPPTLKEKSDELDLVLGRKTSSDSDVRSTVSNRPTNLSQVGELAKDKEKGSPFFKFPSQHREASASPGGTSLASEAHVQRTSAFLDNNWQTTGLKNSGGDAQTNVFQVNGENSKKQGNHTGPDKSPDQQQSSTGTQLPNKLRGGSPSGSKPTLPPISIEKSRGRMKFAVDNNYSGSSAGFSFPTAPPSSSLSEPPTPSIMPFASSVDSSALPTFTFGDKKSAGGLVFAFPCTTSDGTVPDDGPKFKFGSSESRSSRVSFAMIGKDEVCY